MPEANEWTRREQRIMREMRIKFNGEANGKLTEMLRRERERESSAARWHMKLS
jgi:hypothetical protein